ncbi:uncharacterized protein LOC132757804 [Ruditapes philippinarum]|uniref:uncharacterized protein LOC132757804 n=1 Tax=Ruditapes philippinarum TaxID=129788 RepID=UPI00295B89C4|nr:uncharacterized protein LOC132757804 [Ruditapes philippinarum]
MMTDIAQSKEFNIIGYGNRNYMVTGLEEFWNYTVAVTASTSIGSVTSDVSDTYRTLPAAPGKVSSFSVQDGPGQTLKILWKSPNILERNSKIKKYSFMHNVTGNLQSQQTLNQNGDEHYEYYIILEIVPETFYSFEVFAINEQNMNGENTITIKQAHAKACVMEDSNCSTQSIVIGVVLGLIILVLLVYAGYITITLRRIRTKDGQKTNSNDKSRHISPTYVNEAFGSEVTRRNDGNPAEQYSESDYYSLETNTREDRTSYDTLANGP